MDDLSRAFIKEHQDDDLPPLLLAAARYPAVDLPFCVDQIAARRKIKDKLPAWYAHDALLFPSTIAAEQCSSAQTAVYKQRLVEPADCLTDLTGGLGVDAYYFAQKAERVVYVERSQVCFEAAMHNFNALHASNIEGHNVDAESHLQHVAATDVFYLDPARRAEGNRRVHALSDCEPDLLRLLPLALSKARRVIAKLSPMLDIRHALQLLPQTTEVHVVAVRNECKELLFVMQQPAAGAEPLIYCCNLMPDGGMQSLSFLPSEEQRLEAAPSAPPARYLYEPNAAILKAGAFKLLARQMGVDKLQIHSHLYTSPRLLADFPGRAFEVEQLYPFSSRLCRTIAQSIPRANLSVRNFPLTVDELRRRTGIRDGGDAFLFATTLVGNQKVLILCRKAEV